MTAEQIKCPCCGQSVQGGRVRVNLDRNALYYRDQEIVLAPQEAELVFVLARRMPEVVLRGHIVERLWGAKEPENVVTHVNVVIHELRKKLRSTGLQIKNYKDRGFALELVPSTSQTERLPRARPSSWHRQAPDSAFWTMETLDAQA